MAKYHHTIKINGVPLVFEQELGDPFVRVELWISWWDRVRYLFKRKLQVTVIVDGDRDTVAKVMNLDRADWSGVWVSNDMDASA